MRKLSLFSRTATTFSKEGGIDEDALRQFLQRFVDAKVGVYLGSAGSGEGNALTEDELRRVYRIGVEVCKGKVPVNGNPPERQTVTEALRQIMLAVDAGVEIVNIYGPPGWHAYWPTDDEYLAFFDKLLPAVKHPVALAPYTASARGSVGYSPRPALVADICRRHHQIVAVNLTTHDDDYFIELKDNLDRDVDIFVPLLGSMNTLMLGAAGLNGGEFNITPKTFRRYLDLCESRKFDEAALVYADLRRLTRYVSKWRGAHPRWIKMAMKVLKLPGGEGGVRGPYLMPGEDELRKFTEGLLRLRIPEIDELARAAGLAIPS